MPIVGGMDVLKEVKKKNNNTPVILITAYATIDNAVEAVKAGASEYITKPFKVDEIQTKIRKAAVEADFEQGPQIISSDVIKGISNPIRKEVVTILDRKKELRFTDIKNILNIDDASKLSFHLRILKSLEIIDQDKDKIYSLTTRGNKLIRAIKSSDY